MNTKRMMTAVMVVMAPMCTMADDATMWPVPLSVIVCGGCEVPSTLSMERACRYRLQCGVQRCEYESCAVCCGVGQCEGSGGDSQDCLDCGRRDPIGPVGSNAIYTKGNYSGYCRVIGIGNWYVPAGNRRSSHEKCVTCSCCDTCPDGRAG